MSIRETAENGKEKRIGKGNRKNGKEKSVRAALRGTVLHAFSYWAYPEDFFEEPKGPFAKLIGSHKKKQKKSKENIDNILNSENSR